MKTLDILPTQYTPKTIDAFFGPARRIAQCLKKSAEMCGKTGAPASHLLVGPSGSGKSALARFCIEQFGAQPWTTTEAFGASLDMEMAESIAAEMRMSSLFEGYRAYFFDEIDNATKSARDHALKFIGEGQPKRTLVIATSNLTPEAFDALERTTDERGCFTSRFQVWQVACPKADELTPLIECWLPPDRAREVCAMAGTGPNGKPTLPINVRGILRDVTSVLQSIAL